MHGEPSVASPESPFYARAGHSSEPQAIHFWELWGECMTWASSLAGRTTTLPAVSMVQLGKGCTHQLMCSSCVCLQLGTVALYFTYSALEEEMERNKDQKAFAALYFPLELHRKEALAKDLEYFYGENWEEKIQCSEATQRYVDRIHHVGQHDHELLVAHAYTRYMGDLSGGQVLKKVAQRALKLPSTGDGVQFYIFENISNPQQFKQLYRARLNVLDLDQRTKERVVEEANKAFEFNMQVCRWGGE